MLSRFRVRRLAALAVLAAVVAACTVDPVDDERVAETSALLAAAQPVYGETYIDSLLGDISSLIPSITSDAASHTVGGLIYSGLVRFDENLVPEGDLAEWWSFSPDCRRLTFRLRDGVTLDDRLRTSIRDIIRANATPRHVPAKILLVTDIPRTKSGKIVELAVREVIHGRPVRNVEALANAEALDQFRNRPELAEP